MNNFQGATLKALALASALALTACGGGNDAATPQQPQQAAGSTLTVGGTAATGAAMAGAAVQVKCVGGNASTTANADGVFTTTIANASLPCVLTATSSDTTTVLRSVAEAGTANSATANITPISEIVVAQIAAGDAAAFFSNFDAAAQAKLTATGVTTAKATVVAALKGAVDLTGFDALKDPLVAASAGKAGNDLDKKLDALGAALQGSQTTLADVVTTVVANPTAPAAIDTLLKPAASDCRGLKSGKVRIVDLDSDGTSTLEFDAVALTAKEGDKTYKLTKRAACDYTIDDAYSTRLLMSRSGLGVLVSGEGQGAFVGVAIPEQTLSVAAVAGTYNRVQTGLYFDSEVGDFGTTVFAASGANGVSWNCPAGADKCVQDDKPKGTLVANANGGFDYMEAGKSWVRLFAFRDATGQTIMVGKDIDGTVLVLTSQAKLELPAVGTVISFWQFNVLPEGLGPVGQDTLTVTAVEGSKFTRKFAYDGHTDVMGLDAPYAGMRYRDADSCVAANGGAYVCSSFVQLTFGGVTVGVSSVPTRRFFTVAITKP